MITTIGLQGPMVDALCIAILAARVCQSTVHVSHVQTDAFVAVRFSFYSVQLVSFLVLIVMAVVWRCLRKDQKGFPVGVTPECASLCISK